MFTDSDECQIDGSCDQLCTNTRGSFTCACVQGYKQEGNRCKPINGKTHIGLIIVYYIVLFIYLVIP